MTMSRRKTKKVARREHPAAARPRGSLSTNLQKQLDRQTRELAEARKQLAEALAGEQARIIITTPQKFTFVLDKIEALPARRYAVTMLAMGAYSIADSPVAAAGATSRTSAAAA